jgi:hypothetical protein
MMAGDPTSRPLLPHAALNPELSFVPQSGQKEPVQRSALPAVSGSLLTPLDYVFVDEHNRHKRLKGVSVARWRRR